MLRTFRVNDVCKFPNAELYEQAIEYARGKGLPISMVTKKDFEEYPFICFLGDCGIIGFDGHQDMMKVKQEITIPEFFQNCDNWKECGSKPSEGEYIRHGAKVKVRDEESDDWETGWRYVVKVDDEEYQHHVFNEEQEYFDYFRFCELDETPEQTERQKQIAELETKMEELHEQITIAEFFQNCDNWKECGSKPSEGEYIRYGAKVKVRDKNDEDWKIGYRYLVCRSQGQYRHLVLRDGDFNTFQYCELDETPEQTERQKQIAELETKAKELHEQIKKLKDADTN